MLSVGATSTVTMALTIQESTDNSTWTTLRLFTESEYADGEFWVDLTPTKRYIRAIVTMATTAATGTYIDFALGALIYDLRYYPENI